MTPRNLFIIILKVIGLLSLKDILIAIGQLVSTIGYMVGGEEMLILLLVAVVSVGLFGVVPYFCLFRTGWLIDKLRLTEQINQDVLPLSMHRSTILSIAVIITGGLLVMHEVPFLGLSLVKLSQERRGGESDPDSTSLIVSVSKIVIGFLLITKQRQLVNVIELKRQQ